MSLRLPETLRVCVQVAAFGGQRRVADYVVQLDNVGPMLDSWEKDV